MEPTSIQRCLQLAENAAIPYREIAAELGTNIVAVCRAVRSAGMQRRQPVVDDQQLAVIEDLAEGASVREIAKRAKCSKTTAWKYVVWKREQEAKQEGQTVVPRKLNTPRRCPKHGRLNIWPCVACQCEAAMEKRTATAQ